jgi:hypothetical protein
MAFNVELAIIQHVLLLHAQVCTLEIFYVYLLSKYFYQLQDRNDRLPKRS